MTLDTKSLPQSLWSGPPGARGGFRAGDLAENCGLGLRLGSGERVVKRGHEGWLMVETMN